MPPRTKADVDAEKRAKKAKEKAERDDARLLVGVRMVDGVGVEREYLWDTDATSSRAGFDLWRAAGITTSELLAEMGREASGAGVEPWVVAAVVFLAKRCARESASFDVLLDEVTAEGLRSGAVSIYPVEPGSAPKA